MSYKIDPDVLHKVAKQVVGLPLEGGELLSRATELLSNAYPDLIDPNPGRWVGSKAGGILGKVRFLYFSPREYIVLFGSPSGTQGFSGRYKHVQIHKFLMSGQIDSYDVDSDQTVPTTLRPGEHACMEKGQARGLTIHPGSWHIEYGRARSSPRCRSRWSTRRWCRWNSSPSVVRRSSSPSWSASGFAADSRRASAHS